MKGNRPLNQYAKASWSLKTSNTSKHLIILSAKLLSTSALQSLAQASQGATNLFPIRYCLLQEWVEEADATRTNLLKSYIGERRLPPATYKHELTSRVYPSPIRYCSLWVHSTCKLMLISCGWKVSLKFGIEQIRAGGIGLLGPLPKRTIPDWEKIRSSHNNNK